MVDFADPVTKPGELFQTEDQMFRWAYLGQDHLATTAEGPTCLREEQIADNNNEQNVRNCGEPSTPAAAAAAAATSRL